MLDYEFVIKKDQIETAKDKFLNRLAVAMPGQFSRSVYDIAERLQTFDGPGTKDQLQTAGLHEVWYLEYCDVCSNYHDKVVSFDVNGGEYDYDICETCLEGAIKAIRKD